MGERLTQEEVESQAGWGHKVRYRLASGFVKAGDRVVDAACGIGYGESFINNDATYYGIDLLDISKRAETNRYKCWIEADLQEIDIDFTFDVGISFETIEHLPDYSNLIKQLKKAEKWVICSVPVVPTVHLNEYHVHDFAPLEFPFIFEDENWDLYQYLGQPQELSEIYIFKNRNFNDNE